jgi:exosome complex RNA-binding protein Rrp42 (RNase PH superfamily)
MEKNLGKNKLKIIAHHEHTTIKIASWQDQEELYTHKYTTQDLNTQLCSEFHYCTLMEALTIVSVHYFSAVGGTNQMMIVDPSVKEFVVGKNNCVWRSISRDDLKWYTEVWQLQREIRDVRSRWNNK